LTQKTYLLIQNFDFIRLDIKFFIHFYGFLYCTQLTVKIFLIVIFDNLNFDLSENWGLDLLKFERR